MRRLLALTLAGIIVGGCASLESELGTTPTTDAIAEVSEAETIGEVITTEILHATQTTPMQTTEYPTIIEEPTTKIKELIIAEAELSKIVTGEGLQWRVDSEWRENSENGQTNSYNYFPEDGKDSILLILLPIDSDNLITEDDYHDLLDLAVSVFEDGDGYELLEVREVKDRDGKPARELDLINSSEGVIGRASLTMLGGRAIFILGASDSADYQQVVRDISDSFEESESGYEPMKPIMFEGSGDDVISFDTPERPFIIDIIGNFSEKHFAVWAHNSNNQSLLVNTIEEYFGIHPDVLNGTNELEIIATGEWIVVLYDWSEMDVVSPGETYEGFGDGILYMLDVDRSKPISVTIEGNESGKHFAVREYLVHMDDGWRRTDLLINTVDPYFGTVRSKRGNALYITGSGKWTVEISQ